jgi:cytochrome c-type biogenesis protein
VRGAVRLSRVHLDLAAEVGRGRAFEPVKRHYAGIQVAAGAVLVAMGALVVSGELFRLNIEVQRFLDRFDLNFFQSV